LSPLGRATATRLRPPTILADADWVASPLTRARETALLMCPGAVTIEPRLTEMDWGRWEGHRLAALRAKLGSEMSDNEARGLDFRPDGGESPRDVQARLAPWLAETAVGDRTLVAVTHKGVIRAILALATGWNMTGKPPIRLTWNCTHLLTLAPDGTPAIDRPNVPFVDP
jgi:probable phosphoglycerate mutase